MTVVHRVQWLDQHGRHTQDHTTAWAANHHETELRARVPRVVHAVTYRVNLHENGDAA